MEKIVTDSCQMTFKEMDSIKLLTNWPSFHYSVQKLHQTKFKFFPEADVEA